MAKGCVLYGSFFSLRDHAGGNEKMVKLVPGLTVYGGDDRVDALTSKVKHNNTFKVTYVCQPNLGHFMYRRWRLHFLVLNVFCLYSWKVGSLNVKCLFTPCHTTGHICYYVTKDNSSEPPAVFTGLSSILYGYSR